MEINGKEITFRATIRAVMEITELCPDGDIAQLEKLFSGGMDTKTLRTAVKVLVALANGTITEDELLDLDVRELDGLLDVALRTFRNDQKPTVEVNLKKEKAAEADR